MGSSSDTWPTWNSAPCKYCGSYCTTLPQDTAVAPAWRVTCSDCHRKFSVFREGRHDHFFMTRGERLEVPLTGREVSAWRLGERILPPAKWELRTSDGRHEYVASPDWLYGKRWLLQINVLCSGYWLVWGSSWTRWGLRLSAVVFREHWAAILLNPASRPKYRLRDDVIELAKKAAAGLRHPSRDGGFVPDEWLKPTPPVDPEADDRYLFGAALQLEWFYRSQGLSPAKATAAAVEAHRDAKSGSAFERENARRLLARAREYVAATPARKAQFMDTLFQTMDAMDALKPEE